MTPSHSVPCHARTPAGSPRRAEPDLDVDARVCSHLSAQDMERIQARHAEHERKRKLAAEAERSARETAVAAVRRAQHAHAVVDAHGE